MYCMVKPERCTNVFLLQQIEVGWILWNFPNPIDVIGKVQNISSGHTDRICLVKRVQEKALSQTPTALPAFSLGGSQ